LGAGGRFGNERLGRTSQKLDYMTQQPKIKSKKTLSDSVERVLWGILKTSKDSSKFVLRVSVVVMLIVVFGSQIIEKISSETRSVKSVSPQTSQPLPPKLISVVQNPAPLEIEPANQPSLPSLNKPSQGLQPSRVSGGNNVPTYTVGAIAHSQPSRNLKAIVDQVVSIAGNSGLPTDALSVSLIDLKSKRSAAYQDDVLRFPASISKMFWMVETYAWIQQGLLPAQDGEFNLSACKQSDICYMIQNSDNEAASRIVDRLTSTQSIANNLSESEYKGWLDQRRQLNSYFRQAGFKDINVSQKNFPIPYLKLDKPVGPELQMRGDPSSPYRNKISTAQASQVMYDIVNGQAVSPDKSQKMMELLNRYDLQTGAWKGKQYNEIEGFLGEGLDPNVSLLSKVGWTSESRQEVVRITSPDGRADYILVIFADHPAYAKDWKIFPNLSKFVYDKMIQNPTANIGDA
jgi:hypothetical protein